MGVTFTTDRAVGTITLDNPPANSYDIDLMRSLAGAIGDASAADVRVVVLRSASERFFSAGADVKRFLANDPAANMDMVRVAHEALAGIARSPKLFVAWIAGHALGGGLEIALACDLRYAAEGSFRLGTPEVTLGLLPGNGGTQRLPRIIGVPRALDLMVTGRPVSPGEAHGLGILNRLFPAAETAEKTRAYAEALAAGATAAIGEIKLTAYAGIEMDIADALAREREGIARLFETADAAEGFASFAEKRKPEFKGA